MDAQQHAENLHAIADGWVEYVGLSEADSTVRLAGKYREQLRAAADYLLQQESDSAERVKG